MMNCVERYEAEGTAAKVNAFRIKQQLPYDQKVILAEMRAKEFYRTMTNQGHNVHVSVGGLDSITLLLFLATYRTYGCACGTGVVVGGQEHSADT